MARGLPGSQTNPKARGQWATDQRMFLGIAKELMLEFTLDAAALPHNTKVPGNFITPDEDSLSDSVDWVARAGEGAIWLNPPYENVAPWLTKCRETANQGKTVVALLPAATSSEWFDTMLMEATRVFLITNGRVAFHHPEDGKLRNANLGGSVFAVYEPEPYPAWAEIHWMRRDTLLLMGME